MSKSDFLFLLVLATLPIQLNKFFFPEYSYVLGLPIDYRSPTVYLSDIAIIAYLIAFIFANARNLSKIAKLHKAFTTALLIFNFYLFASTAFSTSKEASLIFNMRILVFSMLAVASAHTIAKKSTQKLALSVISISLFWGSLLILAQFLLQKSLGLWILGERSFQASTPTIAHATLFGQQILRPYGTFPHPNVAGAFLVFGLIVIWSSRKITFPIAAIAVLLTFSRTALLVLATTAFLNFSKNRKLLGVAIAAVLAIPFGSTVLNSIPAAPIAERLLLLQAALDISLLNPVFGVGSNNFILELSKLNLFSLAETRLLQPVHNVFLLILAENGIIGLLLFASLLMVVAQNVKGKVKTALFLALLVYASFDHFLWTLHQGQLMFWLILGFIVSRNNRRKS